MDTPRRKKKRKLRPAGVWPFSVYNPDGGVTFTAALTGTALSSINEQNIIDGGDTIIITITGSTWVASGATFDAQRQNIIDGMVSAQSETNGWNNDVNAALSVTDVVRTSDTIVTVTLPAVAGYQITSAETVTVTVPATAVTDGLENTVATPTIGIAILVPTASQSTASVPAGEQGVETSITVQVKDQNGNNWTAGGDTVAGSVTGANTATCGVVDNSNGTYTLTYTPANTGSDSIAITLNGVAISGSPYTSVVSVTPVLTSTPVAWWDLSETSGTRADSVGTLDLTDVNTVTSGDGVGAGQTAAQFDGANAEELTHADNAILRIGNRDWTCVGWMFIDTGATNCVFVAKRDGSLPGSEYTASQSSLNRAYNIMRNATDTAGVQAITANDVFPVNEWHFIEFGYDATNDYVFIRINNGTLYTAADTTGSFTSTNVFRLGGRNGSGNLTGRIQSVAIFHNILDAGDRAWLYNGGTAARLYSEV